MPRSSASTCLDKLPRYSAFFDTVPRPSGTTCIDKMPRPSSSLEMVPQPSIMPTNGASAKFHDIPI